jgi:hypothetical protein
MSREDRLFVLATVCRQRNITPANNLYKAVILKTCAAEQWQEKVPEAKLLLEKVADRVFVK